MGPPESHLTLMLPVDDSTVNPRYVIKRSPGSIQDKLKRVGKWNRKRN